PFETELAPGAFEEGVVLGVGAWPPALDEVHAQLVQETRHSQLLPHGGGHPHALGPVPEGRVVDLGCPFHLSSSLKWRRPPHLRRSSRGQRLTGGAAPKR